MSRWTGKGDGKHWADPANWSDGVPASGVTASFTAGTTESVRLSGATALTTGELVVSGDTLLLHGGTLNLAPPTAQSGNTIDFVLGQNAHLTVAAGTRLLGNNVAEIGNGTGATLTVLGTVAEEYGIVQAGTLDVSGPHGHWLSGDSGLYVGNATFTVEAGAHVDTGGKLAQYPAAALMLEGNSTALVTGAGSVVHLANVFVSENSGTGSLTVQDGGAVFTGGGDIGDNGDATLTVTGAGSLFRAQRGLTIGGQVPVASRLVVENGGTVEIGKYGLSLNGTLAIDGASSFKAPSILSGGGVIEATSGTVDLSSKLQVYANNTDPNETGTTYLEADAGATLSLSGAIATAIPNDTSKRLEAGAGHIVLTHTNNGYGGTTEIYAATLEIAAKGAAGTGGLAFIGGDTIAATLQIDANVSFANVISGFAAADTIDLPAFTFADVALAFTPSANGGTLTLTNADDQKRSFGFAGTHLSAASFATVSDGHGGTSLIHG